MKRMIRAVFVLFLIFVLYIPAYASTDVPEEPSAFDLDEQLDALGGDELVREIPQDARELMEETGTYDLSVSGLLQLSPRNFFKAIWNLLLGQLAKPVKTLGAVVAVIILCALVGGLRTAAAENATGRLFTTISILCILTSVAAPILDCVVETSRAVKDAALFMLTFVPVYSAAMTASGQPVTGATYNLFLFSTCQIVSQIVAQTLIPLMGIYLALCIVGAVAPEINISSATATIKSVISWTLGFFLTVFVGLLSVQTMVSQSADGVAAKTTKFLIGSFVPVVGGALSEAFTAAQGCMKLLKTTLGAYGVFVVLFTFLPILLQTVSWYFVTNLASIAGDIIGVPRVSAILKSCSGVLGILIAVILCFALLMIVSTAVVMVTGLGTG